MFTKTKINNNRRYLVARFSIFLSALVCCVSVLGTSVASALARSYNTNDTTIKVGMVVASVVQGNATASGKDPYVQKATLSNANLAIGVVINKNAAQVSYLNPNAGKNELVVEDSGQVTAYVSDVNGVPKAGDLLAPSPLAGILMRASQGTQGVIGAMVGGFRPSAGESQTLKNGLKVTIAPAVVDMSVRTANVPIAGTGIQAIVGRLVGHSVTETQALVAITIALIALVIVGGVMYGGIANYLQAIGRNPLAKSQLRRALYRVFGLAVAVIGVGMVACWAVLWL